MTVGSEFEGVKPTPPGVGQRLEVRGSKKEARGLDPPDLPANRTLLLSDVALRKGNVVMASRRIVRRRLQATFFSSQQKNRRCSGSRSRRRMATSQQTKWHLTSWVS